MTLGNPTTTRVPRIPRVVIVGRPNVGKSSMLNLLAGRRVSIVDPTAGVTRDRVSHAVTLPGEPPRVVELIDTGGYGIEDTQGLTAHVERQIALALAQADLVLFLLDAQDGVTPLDEEVARMLREEDLKVPVLLVANKVDAQAQEPSAAEASRLGFGAPIMVSATTGRGQDILLGMMRRKIDFDAIGAMDQPPEPGMLLALVGKRNAGKSTLVNALAGQERVIVSEVEGTTRDSVDVRFELEGRAFTAIDTAGVRKRKSVKGDIEFYSLHRSLRSIRRADVVLLLLDATLPTSQVDEHLAQEIVKHHKPCVVVVNKWDLAETRTSQEAYVEYLGKTLPGLNFAPIAFVSAAQGEGVRELVAMALNLFEQSGHRVSTSELNEAVQSIVGAQKPAAKGGRSPKVYYATQLGVHPPFIALFVNQVDLFDVSYERYLINRFRDLLPYAEVPIKLAIRPRKRVELQGD